MQPHAIPEQAWSKIAMDIIKGLPLSKGYNIIMVVVDRFTMYAHFIPLGHPFSAQQVAHAFVNVVFKLHGLHRSIVSNLDPLFLSYF